MLTVPGGNTARPPAWSLSASLLAVGFFLFTSLDNFAREGDACSSIIGCSTRAYRSFSHTPSTPVIPDALNARKKYGDLNKKKKKRKGESSFDADGMGLLLTRGFEMDKKEVRAPRIKLDSTLTDSLFIGV